MDGKRFPQILTRGNSTQHDSAADDGDTGKRYISIIHKVIVFGLSLHSSSVIGTTLIYPYVYCNLISNPLLLIKLLTIETLHALRHQIG